jgi:LacI family transcriptional regulator
LFCTHTKTVTSILDDVFTMLTMNDAKDRPTAFVVGDDHLAAQVMQYLKKFGLRIPEDAAVMGWGNIPSSHITTPELTTVDSEIELFAGEVSEALVDLVNGKQPENRLYQGKLVIREST